MLILARHGRTALNADGLLQGRIDAPLDSVGQTQAAQIGRCLAGADRVISSPLVRATDTAAAIGPAVEVDDRFIELDFGDFDGTRLADLDRAELVKWQASLDHRPPGGESFLELGERVCPALEELADEAQRCDIVVVSHVSPIKAAVAWALGASFDITWRSHLDQASITRIGFRGGRPLLLSFNEIGHLE